MTHKAPKRGRGRPPTPASTHHSESVEVRLTPALENLYRASGLNVRVGASTVDGAL